jgi:hypothetical protein
MLSFLLGVFVGAFFGIVAMGCLVVAGQDDERERR